MLYNPVEQLGIDMFGQSVTSVGGLKPGEGLDVGLCGRLQLPVAQPLGHVLIGHAHQLTERCQVTIVGLKQKVENVHLLNTPGKNTFFKNPHKTITFCLSRTLS